MERPQVHVTLLLGPIHGSYTLGFTARATWNIWILRRLFFVLEVYPTLIHVKFRKKVSLIVSMLLSQLLYSLHLLILCRPLFGGSFLGLFNLVRPLLIVGPNESFVVQQVDSVANYDASRELLCLPQVLCD